MSDEAAFLRAIQANPADATAKLVYADWLEERGEWERAEYVRSVVEKGDRHLPMRGCLAPLRLRGAWLDLFHNRAPLWDPVTLLALGRLDGWLAAFAKCSQHSANIEYAFQANLLPRSGSVQSMADEWFGPTLQPVRLEQLSDWPRTLRNVLHTNLLAELGNITAGPSGTFPAWNVQLALQVNYGRDWIIDAVEDAILAVIRPTAGWEVHITEGENVSYGLRWTDLALEASDRILFLHFSFSD